MEVVAVVAPEQEVAHYIRWCGDGYEHVHTVHTFVDALDKLRSLSGHVVGLLIHEAVINDEKGLEFFFEELTEYRQRHTLAVEFCTEAEEVDDCPWADSVVALGGHVSVAHARFAPEAWHRAFYFLGAQLV